jgi:hypothetical protein
MECLTAAPPQSGTCTICGNQKANGETWFLITENGWEDRLNVWRWHRQMATGTGAHSLCSPRHVRELVVHWMTTGCLHYPFASSTGTLKSTNLTLGPLPGINDKSEPVTPHLGEIAVDREGILRVLRENPLSLNTILDELMIVLEKELIEETEAEPDDELHFALPSI